MPMANQYYTPENQAIFERLQKLRVNNPISYALCKIGVMWDDVNAVYEKNGRNADFEYKLATLKALIHSLRGVVDKRTLNEYKKAHPNQVKSNGKVQHGYNFEY